MRISSIYHFGHLSKSIIRVTNQLFHINLEELFRYCSFVRLVFNRNILIHFSSELLYSSCQIPYSLRTRQRISKFWNVGVDLLAGNSIILKIHNHWSFYWCSNHCQNWIFLTNTTFLVDLICWLWATHWLDFNVICLWLTNNYILVKCKRKLSKY